MTRRLAVLAVLAASLLLPGAAMADCASIIISKAFNGQVVKGYPPACYLKAKHQVGSIAEIVDYTNVVQNIEAGYQIALNAARKTTPAAQSTTTTSTGTGPAALTTGGRGGPPARHIKPSPGSRDSASNGRQLASGGLVGKYLLANSSKPSEVPTVVFVLGGLALLLVLAGLASLLIRRRMQRGAPSDGLDHTPPQ
jgi:hypothetical protein